MGFNYMSTYMSFLALVITQKLKPWHIQAKPLQAPFLNLFVV
jgi:hypothetical protein